MDIKATFKFYAVENQPYVGAYRAGSFTEGNPQVMFAMDFHTYMLKDVPKEELTEAFKDGVLQTLTHEFCHAMQEMLDKEFDELEVEKILGAYKPTWNVFEAPDAEELPEDVFKIADLLRWIDSVDCKTAEDFKSALNHLFMGHRQWIEAHGMTQYESLKAENERLSKDLKRWKRYRQQKLENEDYRRIFLTKDRIIKFWKDKNMENVRHYYNQLEKVHRLEAEVAQLKEEKALLATK